MIKHTKAPWFIHRHHIVDKHGREIAAIYSIAVYKDSTISVLEANKNARLIASSPELLKHAQKLVNRIDLKDCSAKDIKIVKELQDVIDNAKS